MSNNQHNRSKAENSERSLKVGLISISLLALAGAFLSTGPLPAISILVAASGIYFAVRGLPRALLAYAMERRGETYLGVLSLAVPLGIIALSAYLVLLLTLVLRSNLPLGVRLGIPLSLVALAGIINIVTVAINVVSAMRPGA